MATGNCENPWFHFKNGAATKGFVDDTVDRPRADYRHLLAEHGHVGSMGRRGDPYDNAKAQAYMDAMAIIVDCQRRRSHGQQRPGAQDNRARAQARPMAHLQGAPTSRALGLAQPKIVPRRKEHPRRARS